MTILCFDNCHVWLGSSSLCTCEAHRVAMYGFPQNYNPFAPTRATPPTASDLPAVDVARLRSAERAGAGWLSSDGLRAYRDDRGGPEVSFWSDEADRFLSWWTTDRVPADAVRLATL